MGNTFSQRLAGPWLHRSLGALPGGALLFVLLLGSGCGSQEEAGSAPIGNPAMTQPAASMPNALPMTVPNAGSNTGAGQGPGLTVHPVPNAPLGGEARPAPQSQPSAADQGNTHIDAKAVEAQLNGLEKSIGSDLPPGPNNDPELLALLTSKENEILEAWKSHNPEKYLQNTAVIGISVDASGKRIARNTALEQLKTTPIESFKLFNFRLIKLGTESAALTYHTRLKMKDQPELLVASSTVWQKTDVGWKARFHQDTPVTEGLPQWKPAEGSIGRGNPLPSAPPTTP